MRLKNYILIIFIALILSIYVKSESSEENIPPLPSYTQEDGKEFDGYIIQFKEKTLSEYKVSLDKKNKYSQKESDYYRRSLRQAILFSFIMTGS